MKRLAAVDEAGIQLQIGFNRRFDANHARLKRAIERRRNRRSAYD